MRDVGNFLAKAFRVVSVPGTSLLGLDLFQTRQLLDVPMILLLTSLIGPAMNAVTQFTTVSAN